MYSDQQIWRTWAEKLHRWGLGEWVASFLEAAGSLTPIGAQLLYVSQPFLDFAWPESHIEALAEMLEEPEKVRVFAAYLRQEIG